MDKYEGVIWMDGEPVPWQEAKVHVLTHTLHYGMGAFEGIRAYQTKSGKTAIFRLTEHIDRLFDSAHILQMKLPYSKDETRQACMDVVKENKLHDAYIRPMCFYGAEDMGLRANQLKVHVMVAAWSWGSYLGKKGMEQGIRVKTASIVKHHINAAMCKAKANGYYINSILALQEAIEGGYDEALLLDNQGYIAEGSGENIFLIFGNTLVTPCLTAALDGITRKTIISLAQENGLAVEEKLLTRDTAYIADEAFFTGTAAEVTPIREIDKRQIGNGSRGPITEKLQSLYFQCVKGETKRYLHWLQFID